MLATEQAAFKPAQGWCVTEKNTTDFMPWLSQPELQRHTAHRSLIKAHSPQWKEAKETVFLYDGRKR